MTDSHVFTIDQIKSFLKVDSKIKFKTVSKKEKYEWIDEVLTKFRYLRLKKKNKGIVRDYIKKMTGISDSQLTRLVKKKRESGKVFYDTTSRHTFPRKYGPTDIGLLVKTDNAHKRLSGQATKRILQREWDVFHNRDYKNISEVSVAHLYNLRETRQYRSHSKTVKQTQSTQVPIGKRKKPEPEGKPGFLRVDTVHQGDRDKEKGVYHINAVDEITRWGGSWGCRKGIRAVLKALIEGLNRTVPFPNN